MSFLAGLGISSDKPPIVLEIGSKFTKIGFSGEAGPRAIVHTPIDFENSNNDEIGEFLLWIYNIHLQISPRERRLLFVDKINEKSTFRENLTKIALKRLAVPGVVFLSRPVAAVTTSGISSNSGLSVNLGWSSLSVTPVVHGVPLIWNEKLSELGASKFTHQLKEETLKINDSFEDIDNDFIDDIISRVGFIRGIEDVDNPRESLVKQDESFHKIDFDGKKLLKVKRGHIAETLETLFVRYAEDNTLPTLVLDALLEAPIDSRRALAGNIILGGGLSRLPGLPRRLLQEIDIRIKEEKYQKLKNLDFLVTDMPCCSNCISWLGGSIFAAGESVWRNQIDLQGLKIADDKYDFEKIPDWCGNPLPEPKPVTSRPSLSTQSPIRRMLQISKFSK